MRMRKAIFSLIMIALVFTTACSGEKNETGTTEQEQGVNSELTTDDLKNPDDTVPTGEKDLSDELDDFTFGLDGYTYQLPMPLSYFLKLLEKDATVKEVFSVYEYENYDGTKSVRYTYADSMTAAREFNFVDGKLKGISIYNKRCGYRSNTGETLTKSR